MCLQVESSMAHLTTETVNRTNSTAVKSCRIGVLWKYLFYFLKSHFSWSKSKFYQEARSNGLRREMPLQAYDGHHGADLRWSS